MTKIALVLTLMVLASSFITAYWCIHLLAKWWKGRRQQANPPHGSP